MIDALLLDGEPINGVLGPEVSGVCLRCGAFLEAGANWCFCPFCGSRFTHYIIVPWTPRKRVPRPVQTGLRWPYRIEVRVRRYQKRQQWRLESDANRAAAALDLYRWERERTDDDYEVRLTYKGREVMRGPGLRRWD